MDICNARIAKYTGWISCRRVLGIMVCFGFMFGYMLRVNMSIAIVDMIRKPEGHSKPDEHPDQTRFNWTTTQKNDILGLFFWGYLATQLAGGRLAEVIGATKVLGGALLGASILTILTQLSCLNFYVLVVNRVFVGVFLGVTFPAGPPIAAKWIPPNERSKFVANFLASSLGAAITMPICGVLIAAYGWASVFYVTGAIGLLWSALWFLIIYDSPAEHPRISPEEKLEIESQIRATEDVQFEKPKSVPWLKLMSSAPVWAILICDTFSSFNLFTLLNELPTYMDEVLKLGIKGNGLLSGLPNVGRYVMAVTSSYFADWIIKSGRISRTLTRKLFTSLAIFVPGFLLIIQAFLGTNMPVAVTVFTLVLFCNGAITGGYMSNGLDIAPNFAGTIMGLSNSGSAFTGWLSTKIVAILTEKDNSFKQWRWVFWIMVGCYMVAGLTYVLLASGNIQKWNSQQIPTGTAQEIKEEKK